MGTRLLTKNFIHLANGHLGSFKCFSQTAVHIQSAAAASTDRPVHIDDRNETILGAYVQKLEQNVIRQDDYQYKIVQSLQSLDDQLQRYSPHQETWLERLFKKKPVINKPQGLYLWGSVGCGKTFLMDLFYENCSISDLFKKRVHFHRFMLDVHSEIHQIKLGKHGRKSESSNPIPTVARLIANRSWLLCLDEFQVTDVVDAMILKQLFKHLFDEGVILVATSNRHPDDLYKSGLQRSTFLPFIPMLKSNCIVKCLDSNIDYRRISSEIRKVYFVTMNETENNNLDSLFKVLSLAEDDIVGPKVFNVNNRNVRLNKTCGGIADCTFSELCEQPLGADDYDRMGKLFHTVIVRDIPQMTLIMKSEIRRFITFIDMMYDNRVRVVFSARVPVDKLFKFDSDRPDDSTSGLILDELDISASESKSLSLITGEEEIFAVDRTISRIIEMQTNQYWNSITVSQDSPKGVDR